MEENIVEIALYLAYVMVIAGTIGAIVFPLIQAFGEPKKLVQAGIGIAGIGVLYLIGWALAGSEVTTKFIENGVDESLSKIIGGVLVTMYLLMGVALIGIVYTEFSKALK